MRAGDSFLIGRKKEGGISFISKSLNGANSGVDCHKYSWTFNFHPNAPPPNSRRKSISPLLTASMCQQHHPQSSLCLSLFSHTAGGWLAQERGIINFLEWQTLDVRRAVLSHPLLGVPQPPSLLPVILHGCVSCFFSPEQPSTNFIHLMLSQG